MELLSRTYGWMPDQIRSMDAQDVEIYLAIIKARHRIKKARARYNP